MKRLTTLVLTGLCLVTAGCSTVGSGAKYLANQAGVYDYPVKFNSQKGVYQNANWESLFGVKPEAEKMVADILDLAESHSRPEDVEDNKIRTMCFVDADHDRVITVLEATVGADNAVQIVSDALGDLKIRNGRTAPTITRR